MAENQLSATSSAGSQDATSSPQTAGQGNLAPGQKSNTLQTGTPQSALDRSSSNGVKLGTATPNVVTLANLPKTTSTKKEAQKEVRHTSPVATGTSLIFIIAAAILLWSALRPVKNTTD